MTGGQRQVTATGSTVGEVIAALDRGYPGMRERLCQGDRLQPGIAIAVDGETATLGLLEPVRPDSEVQILPAIAGG
jgi:molybdopterin converting factor small subunit